MNNTKMLKFKKALMGRKFTDGILYKIIVYVLLLSIGFVYLYPIIFMLSSSFKSVDDIINPMINWIPSKLYVDNYVSAWKVLKYPSTFLSSLLITLLPAIIQTLVTSIIGYGFAKFEFRGKKLFLVLILITFIIPGQVYTIPKYVMFNDWGLLESAWAIILPALFGQGVNSAIFILIFYQFFRMSPKAFDEAAEIEGANAYHVFIKINVPLAIPAYITSFLFSFVWYWNETYISSLFLGGNYQSLQIKLAYFVSEYNSTFAGETVAALNEGIRLAATLLIILPMLIVYFCLQKYFVESVERSGVTGE